MGSYVAVLTVWPIRECKNVSCHWHHQSSAEPPLPLLPGADLASPGKAELTHSNDKNVFLRNVLPLLPHLFIILYDFNNKNSHHNYNYKVKTSNKNFTPFK